MQIRNRLFSYPVYSSDVDDYKSNTFTFDYNAESNGDIVLIQYTTTISNKHILKELNNSEYSTHSEPHRPALRATHSII